MTIFIFAHFLNCDPKMKKVLLLSLIALSTIQHGNALLVSLMTASSSQCYIKFYFKKKIACSVSGNGTCVDPFCFITPVNKTVNAANFGCGLITRPLMKINVSSLLSMSKISSNHDNLSIRSDSNFTSNCSPTLFRLISFPTLSFVVS